MTNRLSTPPSARIVIYCASCDSEFGEADKSDLGVRVICKNDLPENPTHLAQVVKGETGKCWLRKRLWLYKYETRWCLRQCKRWHEKLKENAGLFIFIQFLILLFALFFNYWFSERSFLGILLLVLTLGISVYFIFDILLVNSSVAFVGSFPADPLRSALFAGFCFVNLVLAFSVFYLVLGDHFKPTIDNPIEALYFSFVTITTLGYGDYQPQNNGEGWPVQLVIVLHLLVGLYFIVVLINIFVSWTNSRQMPKPKRLEDLLKKQEKKPKNNPNWRYKMTAQNYYQGIEDIVYVSTNSGVDFAKTVNDYIKNQDYKLLHVGTETSRNIDDGSPWHSTVAVLGK